MKYVEFNGDFTFFCFRPEILFLANMVQNCKMVCLKCTLVLRLTQICWIQWPTSLFLLWVRVIFSKNVKLLVYDKKFGTQIGSNALNSMLIFTFSVLDWKGLFWGYLFQKQYFLRENLLLRLTLICRIRIRRQSPLVFRLWLRSSLEFRVLAEGNVTEKATFHGFYIFSNQSSTQVFNNYFCFNINMFWNINGYNSRNFLSIPSLDFQLSNYTQLHRAAK